MCVLGLVFMLPMMNAGAQPLPPPSRTVFKCEQEGKVL